MVDAPFSYKDWYDKNAEKLNTSRKAKYHTDSEYRKRVLELNQRSRDNKRSELASEDKATQKAQQVVPVASPWKEMEIEVEDAKGALSVQKVLTIGALAKVLGKSIKSVRLWEKSGLIPEAPFRSLKGDRLYPPDLVLEIYEKLQKEGRVSETGPKTRPRSFRHQVRFEGGRIEEMAMFPVGELARACDRNISTIEQMEAKGHFPKTPFRSNTTGYRLYTAGMIEAAREVFRLKRGRSPVDWDLLQSEVAERWTKLGVGSTSGVVN